MFTGIKQIALVTADLDRAVRMWEDKYGIGPWIIMEWNPDAVADPTLNGRPAQWSGHRMGMAKLGETFIEIIQPREDDTETIAGRSLAQHGGRDHLDHIMFDTDDADGDRERLEALGVTSDQGGLVRAFDARFDYMSTVDDLGFWVEIVDPKVLDRFDFEPKPAADAS